MREEEIAALLDSFRGVLANIALSIYQAQEDGKIDWREGIALTTAASIDALSLIDAFKSLSKPSVKLLIDTLSQSKLMFEPRPLILPKPKGYDVC